MKGRLVAVDSIGQKTVAALVVDGELTDLLIDPDCSSNRSEGIFLAKAERLLKRQGGQFFKLPDGKSGCFRGTSTYQEGSLELVQISGVAAHGKASPLSTRITLKRRYAIGTLSAPGVNISRAISDEFERKRIHGLASAQWADAPREMGVILRSACAGQAAERIVDDLQKLIETARQMLSARAGEPRMLMKGPSAAELARRDWLDPGPCSLDEQDHAFERNDIFGLLGDYFRPEVTLPSGGSISVEPTRALTSVDVDTGSDLSSAAALRAGVEAARALPRQLRIRGVGGQVVIDFPPLTAKGRRMIHDQICTEFKRQKVVATFLGWTKLGHYEMHVRRDKIPLADAVWQPIREML